MVQKDFQYNDVLPYDEFSIKYSGDSFEDSMEIETFYRQISSVRSLIKEIFIRGKINNKFPKEVKDYDLFLSLKKGSFEEILRIVFSNPIMASFIGAALYDLFKYILTRDINEIRYSFLEKILKSKDSINDFRNIIRPLKKNNDSFYFASLINNNLAINLSSNDKNIFLDHLDLFEKDIKIKKEIVEMVGVLNKADIQNHNYGFAPINEKRRIKTFFRDKTLIDEIGKIRSIFGEKIKIKAEATFEEEKIIYLDILDIGFIEEKDLGDYINEKDE